MIALLFFYLFSNLVLLIRCKIPDCVGDVTEYNVVSLENMDVLAMCHVIRNVSDRSQFIMGLCSSPKLNVVCVQIAKPEVFSC